MSEIRANISKCKIAYLIDEHGKDHIFIDGKQVYGWTEFKVDAGVDRMPNIAMSYFPTMGLFKKEADGESDE
jgi:hypothetical protein